MSCISSSFSQCLVLVLSVCFASLIPKALSAERCCVAIINSCPVCAIFFFDVGSVVCSSAVLIMLFTVLCVGLV